MHQEDDHYTLLAKGGDNHYIAHCKHDVIHLTWGTATLRFRPQDFTRIAHLLEQGVVGAENREICDGPVCLIQDDSGGFTLMVKNFGLHLDASDFLMLVDLVRTALQQMRNIHKDEPNLPAFPSLAVPVHRYAGNSFFSLN